MYLYSFKILQHFCDQDFDAALMKSTAIWKIVVGHHAIRSIGHHGDSPELVEYLNPILKVYNILFLLLYGKIYEKNCELYKT